MPQVALSEESEGLLQNLNAAAFVLHLALAIVSGVVGNLGLSPPVYEVKNTFQYNSSSTGFIIVPRFEEDGGFPITVMVVIFFSLTAFFHIGNITFLADVYFRGIENCATPTRWVEYTLTASIMSTIIAYLSGLRDEASLIAVAALVGTTMLFGGLVELVARPVSEGAWRDAISVRSLPHFMGYVPYIFAWLLILYSFFESGGACAAPKFVYTIIIGQFVLFSAFIFPQLYQLHRPPRDFYRGEIGFITLSFISKALLGILLLTGGLAQENFDAFTSLKLNDTTCDVTDLAAE
tara:strand:- start:5316 stop:6194 length:879 start_codon:yes stop_codon:yes gene_type:complete